MGHAREECTLCFVRFHREVARFFELKILLLDDLHLVSDFPLGFPLFRYVAVNTDRKSLSFHRNRHRGILNDVILLVRAQPCE